ncbi:MAG: molybdopterin-dependent oxidoreductase [Actinomycetes bacterium]
MRQITRRTAVALGLVGLTAFAGVKVKDRIAPLTESLSEKPSLFESDGFQYYTVVDKDPEIVPADFSLRVAGLVNQEITLTLADLQKLPRTRLIRDFQCVTGWRVKNVPWEGVLLRDILSAAGVQESATALKFLSSDGAYTESLTLEQGMRKDVLVADALFDKPITSKHGGPVRLFVGPMYGYKSLKWLATIEVTKEVAAGYWEVRGYDVDAWVGKSNGRSDLPT